jgi:hypothetical protein
VVRLCIVFDARDLRIIKRKHRKLFDGGFYDLVGGSKDIPLWYDGRVPETLSKCPDRK